MNKNKGEILIYETKEGEFQVEAKLEKETIWLTQKQIAKKFVHMRDFIFEIMIFSFFETKTLLVTLFFV